VDLPFALPTAVAGIALTAIYAPNGCFGAPLATFGIKRRLHRARHLDRARLRGPALRGPHRAAGDRGDRPRDRGGLATLGASLRTMTHVILPMLAPAR
jgi:sulfate/thiosulfate transport system permease protein